MRRHMPGSKHIPLYFVEAKILLRLTDGVITQSVHEGEAVPVCGGIDGVPQGKIQRWNFRVSGALCHRYHEGIA